MSKKKIFFIITFFIIVIFSFFSFNFIKKARETRTWPFNSGLVLYLPQWVKYYAYKYTNPNVKIIQTQFYKIKIEYLTIPNKNSVGGGGSINILNSNNILITLNDGSNYTLDINKKIYTEQESFLKKKYSSIRDAYLDKNNSKIFVLGIVNINTDCKKIIFDSYKYKIFNNKIKFDKSFNIWSSEILCGNPMENNGGGRIEKFNDRFFISTGFFTQNKNSGIVEFTQKIDSSFGKIIKFSDINKSKDNFEIFSIGHRNPQGLFLSKNFNILLSTEHGPRGGDELNIIKENNNYGWPCKTYGTLYSYNFKTNSTIWPNNLEKYGCSSKKNYTDPIFSWSPSIGASQGMEYTGREFPKFKNNFFVSSLKAGSLFRLIMSNDQKIINFEKIFINERIRDLIEFEDGKIFLFIDGGSILELKRFD